MTSKDERGIFHIAESPEMRAAIMAMMLYYDWLDQEGCIILPEHFPLDDEKDVVRWLNTYYETYEDLPSDADIAEGIYDNPILDKINAAADSVTSSTYDIAHKFIELQSMKAAVMTAVDRIKEGKPEEILPIFQEADAYSKGGQEWELRTLKDAYREREPRKYWVNGIFADTSLNIVYGKPEGMKSLLMLDCALSVASGTEWLAPEVKAPELPGGRASKIMQDIWVEQGNVLARQTMQVPVMWLDYDDGMWKTEERVEAIAKSKKLASNGELPFYYASFPAPSLQANDIELMQYLVDELRNNDIKMLFVGNLGTTSGGANENTSDMIEVMSNWRWVAEEAGVTVVIVAHPRKGDDAGLDSLRGHSSIMAAVDLALQVDRDGDTVTVRSTKNRGAPVEHFGAQFWYVWKPDTSDLGLAGFYGVKVDTKRSRTMDACLDIVNTHPDTSIDAIAKAVKGEVDADGKYTVGIKYVKDMLNSMAKDGKLCKVDLGRDNAKGYEVIS